MSDLTVEPVTSFRVRRLTVPIPGVKTFQTRYERAVPKLPLDRVKQLVARGAPWSAMVEMIDDAAPHGFLIYFKNDVHAVMANAGHTTDCVAYLMGNHVIAETMFRHDPRAMLYAPLRTVLWEDRAGRAWFTVDQPSTQFASLGVPEVQAVGEELDLRLALLLKALKVPVPAPLVATARARNGPAA